ncbi:hypothetical protein HOF40_03390 [Candidatus Parcubacteria bacterium]|jgi:hypothetical protein|nr:hypothetical protein [Candidatus Parcubacteria bacterium]MBT3949106.1 hypothetical protein [Candidatus Parcubacteria bacterium]
MYLMYKLAQYKKVLAIAFVLTVGLMLSPNLVGAASGDDPFGVNLIDTGVSSDGTTGEAILLGSQDLRTTAASIINVALSLLGIVSVVIILIGGFRWMTAGGNDEKVGEARKWIFSGIIGLAIILSAWAISRFVLEKLVTATDANQGNLI